MGSTGIGNGIAIPHGRLDNASAPIAVVITTEEAINFDAIDHRLLIFLLPYLFLKKNVKITYVPYKVSRKYFVISNFANKCVNVKVTKSFFS